MDLLAQKADETPGAVFLESAGATLTYAATAGLVAERAAALGDRSGGQVAVQPRLDVESVVEVLAVIAAGATAVVVPAGPPAELQEDLIGRAHSDPRPCHSILFTSGSSGYPKGVRFSLGNWQAAARASMVTLGHGPGDRWLCPLPLHHVGGLSIVFRSLQAGGAVVLSPYQDHTAGWLDRVRFASMVPTQLHRVLRRRTDGYRNHPRVLVGGGPVDGGLLDRAATAGLEVLPTYGMTETTAQAATARPGDPARRLYPLPGLEIAVGPEGRIEVRGETVSLSYLGEPDRRPGEWFATADWGRIEADGSLTVLGRLDRVIISGGEKIDAETVERLLGAVAGVEEVAVIGLPDREWGETVVAAYRGLIEPGELAPVVRQALGPRAVPKRWLRLDRMP
ncbi:MAG TPA: AMP-binding protein, partial [Acidimicrobiia bacterium]|nr:AMP-binding protein [Acidimicrobiia bacterium]